MTASAPALPPGVTVIDFALDRPTRPRRRVLYGAPPAAVARASLEAAGLEANAVRLEAATDGVDLYTPGPNGLLRARCYGLPIAALAPAIVALHAASLRA